ncbi:MAG: FUSC family protein [Saprospiraceae bacterium]
MKNKELSELTDEELLDEAKKMKSNAIMHALLIGCAIGVVVYAVAKNNFGFFGLILIYFAYKMFNNSENNKRNKELEKILKKRNLK